MSIISAKILDKAETSFITLTLVIHSILLDTGMALQNAHRFRINHIADRLRHLFVIVIHTEAVNVNAFVRESILKTQMTISAAQRSAGQAIYLNSHRSEK